MSYLDELKRGLLGFSHQLTSFSTEELSDVVSKIGKLIGTQYARNAELRKKSVSPSAQATPLEKHQQRNLAKELMANEMASGKLFKPANKELAQKARAALSDKVTNENLKNEKFAAKQEWIGKHRTRNQSKSESTETPEQITSPKRRK